MRTLARSLEAQADRFAAENQHAKLALFDSAERKLRDLARDLRINADVVQPG